MSYEHIQQIVPSEVELSDEITEQVEIQSSTKDISKNHYSKWNV